MTISTSQSCLPGQQSPEEGRHAALEILALPDVKERVDLFRSHAGEFNAQLLRCGRVYDNLVVLDLREEETIWSGNGFSIYAIDAQ